MERSLLAMNTACLSRSRECCHNLYEASDRDCGECINRFIQNGADTSATVEIGDKFEWTPLHIAVRKGHISAVRLLLEGSAPVNAPDKRGWTPLHHAVRIGSMPVLKLLIQYGGNVNAPAVSSLPNAPPEEPTPIDFANAAGNAQISCMLAGKS
jgi:ankyrin repeat protein